MLETLGGRKALASITVLVIGIITVGIKGDVPPNLLTLLEFVFGAFVCGNVASKVVYKAKNSESEDVPAQPEALDLSPITSEMVGLKHSDQQLAEGISLIQQSLSMIIQKTGIDRMPNPPGV